MAGERTTFGAYSSAVRESENCLRFSTSARSAAARRRTWEVTARVAERGRTWDPFCEFMQTPEAQQEEIAASGPPNRFSAQA